MIVLNRTRNIIISISVVLLLIIIVSASTYAYFAGTTDEHNVGTDSGELDVVYNISENITGVSLSPVNGREDGIESVAVAKLNTGSVPGLFNLYITPTTIDGLAISALIWEVDIVDKDGNIIDTFSGNFEDATVNTAIKVVDGYELTYDDTTFNIYIWLNGNLLDESISNKKFTAKITADTVDITGGF